MKTLKWLAGWVFSTIVAIALVAGALHFVQKPANYLIVPGKSVGAVNLGMTRAQAEAVMGKPAFIHQNDDGSTLLEWGTFGKQAGSDIPLASVWVVLDASGVSMAGSDSSLYHLANGISAGADSKKAYDALGADGATVFPPSLVAWLQKGVGFSIDMSNEKGLIRSLFVFVAQPNGQ